MARKKAKKPSKKKPAGEKRPLMRLIIPKDAHIKDNSLVHHDDKNFDETMLPGTQPYEEHDD